MSVEYSYHDRYHKATDTAEEILAKLKKMWAEEGNDFEEDGEWVPEFKESHARWVSCPHCVKARVFEQEREERRRQYEAEDALKQEHLKKTAASVIAELQEYIDELKDTTEREVQRFSDLDWEAEFGRMDENPEYTPILFAKDLRDDQLFRRAAVLTDGTVKDLLNKARADERELTLQLRRIMRAKFDEADEVVRPSSLLCERCEVFGDFNDEDRNHQNRECKPNLNCQHCGHKSTTYDRHRAHINLKHLKKWKHKCESCKFSTDSHMAIERHNRSSEHLEKVGTPKAREFRCEPCDKPFRFKSELERHSLSKRHGKTLNL